ncbi:ABC transporter FUM19 [Colletotrichum spinosum]|uniref:ABC transporter FUM19 n=1 Tax=Colletotrichum spinosum TaxID=1347390 RepID=A0A4R8QGQ4_9PEZI|nr:ABC transporter FUM19 [Colletotrichum spinosum]
MQLVTGLIMMPLSLLEHSRGRRPSVLLSLYLLITLLFDIAHTRTLWLLETTQGTLTQAQLSSAAIALKILILILESLKKAGSEIQGPRSPETNSGIFGLSTYFWVNGLLLTGFRKQLTGGDLIPLDDSIDVERIKAGFLQIHEYWANSIEAALACWLLQRKIGAAFAAPVGVVLLCAIASSVTAKVSGRRQTLWMTAIQQRVGVTAKIISSMKAIKISALSVPMEKVLHNLRLEDLSVGGKWRWTLLAAGLIALTPSQLGPVMAFAATSRALDVSRIFTSMAYLILLAGPLGSLYQNDLSLIDSELPLSLINFSVLAFAAMGMATVIAVSSPWSALSYPLLLAVLCLLQLFYLKTSKQLRILELEAKGPLT